jgi:hypothetical protein
VPTVVRRAVIGVATVVRRAVIGVPTVVRRAVIGVPTVVRRPMIGVLVLGGLRMIMLGLRQRWFRERIADVFRNRLTGTVISAVPHPAGQFRDRGPGRVIADGCSLRHRIRRDIDYARTARQHRLGHILRGRPVHSRHLENDRRSLGCHRSSRL